LGYPATFTEATPAPGETVRTFLDAGSNPTNGVVVTYWLKDEPTGEVMVRFLDSGGRLVREFSSAASPTGSGNGAGPRPSGPAEPRAPKSRGLNRFVWNLRHAPARGVPGDVLTERSLSGPVVAPGRYRVELVANGQTLSADLDVRKDPRVT